MVSMKDVVAGIHITHKIAGSEHISYKLNPQPNHEQTKDEHWEMNFPTAFFQGFEN